MLDIAIVIYRHNKVQGFKIVNVMERSKISEVSVELTTTIELDIMSVILQLELMDVHWTSMYVWYSMVAQLNMYLIIAIKLLDCFHSLILI